jgi:hypothetical protein
MKKIFCIAICMLMFVTASAVTAKMNVDDSTDIFTQTGTPLRSPGQILLQFDVQTNTTYQGYLGAEWDGQYFWTTGCAASGTAPYFIQKWDISGHKIGEYTQPNPSTWGMRDMAFDGTYLYSGSENGFWKIDPATGATTLMFASIAPMTVIRALTWVPSENMFYTASFGASWYKFTPDGATKTPITNPGLTGEYGMAYDSINDTIWVFNQETTLPQTVFHEYNYHTKVLTGKIWQVPLLGANTAQLAGGCFYATDIFAGKATLGGMTQGTPLDRLFVMELGLAGPPNYPPSIPAAPAGPSSGNIGISYSFTASTTDPESDQISYMFDWDDGNNSGWLGPFASGATATGSHTWGALGAYDIKVKAKDTLGHETNWSSAHIFTIVDSALLKIDWIKGGLFKVSASVHNIGGLAATNVAWTITFTGGAFIGKETTGTIASLAPGAAELIKSKFILGFGATVVKVTATITDSTATMEKPGQIILFLIKI